MSPTVDEPCQPGCSNLSFCSSFNNRPLELFRNCNPEADAAAQNVFQEWIRMTRVVLPGNGRLYSEKKSISFTLKIV